jgi:SAM-dependent methyltransferase
VSRTNPKNKIDNVDYIISECENIPSAFYNQFDCIILSTGFSPNSLPSSKLLDTLCPEMLAFSYFVDNLLPRQKLVYFSSAAIYGKGELCSEDSPIVIGDLYSLGKHTSDTICDFASGKQIYGLRIGTLSGPAPITRTDLVVNKMVSDGLLHGAISMVGNDVKRAILGTNDMCGAVQAIINDGTVDNSGIYNLCSFNSSIGEIADTISNTQKAPILPPPLTQTQVLQRSSYSFTLDTSKFCNTFNFQFKQTLGDIIQQLVEEYNEVECVSRANKNAEYNITNNCRVCGIQTKSLLDLHSQPLANYYHLPYEFPKDYPLHLQYCPHCFHVQLNCTVNPDILFKHYLYVSGTSKTGAAYFADFAKNALQPYINTEMPVRVLDIACNDGSQLDAFKQVGGEMGIEIQTVGVDPAENLAPISISKGHSIYCEYYDEDTNKQLLSAHGKFDIVVAQNVFAHVYYPMDFLKACKEVLHPEGTLYIQTSQAKMIENGEFDTAYHEHLSFFNTNSMKFLCDANGLVLNKVALAPIHGTSYVFSINLNTMPDNNVIETLYDEMVRGLYDENTYASYKRKCIMYKNKFHNTILEYRDSGYTIVGYGSTAKSNTLLNFCGLSDDDINAIVDDNPLKVGLLTPGTNIPIINKEQLQEMVSQNEKVVLVVLAWNFFNEIYAKLRKEYPQLHILNINPITTFPPNK